MSGGAATLALEIESGVRAPAVARAAIRDFTDRHDVSDGAIATTMLLVSEVVTNAVVHPDVAPPAVITLYVRLDRDRLRVEVADNGAGFVPAPRDPERRHGGYGLFLLDRQALRWGVERRPRAVVWFEVDAAAAAEP